MPKVYHLDLEKKDLKGARVALLPGDPGRVEGIARAVAVEYGTISKRLASKREFTTYLSSFNGNNLIVTSTGIGGPSASIAIDELAQLGINTFIRVGTTGAIQEFIKDGDCVITTGSVRLDGASTHYAPIEYPAVADHCLTNALVKGAEAAGVKYHLGVTASSDTFYPGEERTDSFRKFKMRRFRGATEELRALHVLNYEMESSTVLALTASMGLKGACITGVVNRGSVGRITPESLKKGEDSAIRAVVKRSGFINVFKRSD